MLSYDGIGYGVSVHWQSLARQIAESNGEICTCWYNQLPMIDVAYDGTYQIFVKCVLKRDDCPDSFPNTNMILTRKFKAFYTQYEQDRRKA